MSRILPPDANLVPEKAELVFKGEIFDVYQWEQKLYDDSLATFEMLKRPDTVIIIPLVDNELIYIVDKQPPSQNKIGFPGGRVDANETWDDAAKRELLEETGLTFNNWKLIDVIQPVHKIEWFIAYYVAWDKLNEVEPDPGSGEIIEIKSGSIEEVVKLLAKLRSNNLPNSLKNVKISEDILKIEAYDGARTS